MLQINTGTVTVEVGGGLTWGQVYVALALHEVNVVGGRVPGVGVAGLTLGRGERLPSADVATGYQLQISCGLFLEKQPIRPHN